MCSIVVKKLRDDDYVMRMNHLLPSDIRVLAFSFVPEEFDARFSCRWREYKYFFFKKDLDIKKMERAAQKLMGLHDFRNFCKKDRKQTQA